MGSQGKLFVVAAPSGAGKTSLVRALMKRVPDLRFSISYTTRRQRETEKHEHDYFFVTREQFQQRIDAGDFLEHAQVFDNFYGTSRSQVQGILDSGHNVLLEIDWQGARQIRRAMPQSQSIFILPPSRAELERRLRDRKTDSDEVIARRLRDSIADMSHWNEFDYVVVNDDFERAVNDLQAIVEDRGDAFRATRSELQTLVRSLLG
ncbi:guanylate kinase [Povalibacter uvarum]|uniref:guanylate kinase n=1 Tax=Povalibacter uvarum TaxID=732238 RepID=UPI0016210F03